jgi:Dehydroquinase class II
MPARLMILNGPNLNLLGVREPHIYGSTTLPAIRRSCEEFAAFLGAAMHFEQSNHEGALVDLIHAARQTTDAIIINPAGYSFTSINRMLWSSRDDRSRAPPVLRARLSTKQAETTVPLWPDALAMPSGRPPSPPAILDSGFADFAAFRNNSGV